MTYNNKANKKKKPIAKYLFLCFSGGDWLVDEQSPTIERKNSREKSPIFRFDKFEAILDNILTSELEYLEEVLSVLTT